MKASILIVSKNRKIELMKTLTILEGYLNKGSEEILVFLDGSTDGSHLLKEKFPWVAWFKSEESVGASSARKILYEKAKGEILIGLDDDSHPLQKDFVQRTYDLFQNNTNLGIIAYREIKGIFKNDSDIPEQLLMEKEDFFTRDFMGCGFAIKRKTYEKTRGFPEWIDIYGEEVCVALETISLNQQILFTYEISVNHRVDRIRREKAGLNYFRFEKQLKNTTSFYLVYYPFPLVLGKLARLYLLNFLKYASKDRNFLLAYFRALKTSLLNIRYISRYREPVSRETVTKFNSLMNPDY